VKEKMNKKVLGIALASMFLAMLLTPLVSTVQAKNVIQTDMGFYDEYIGTLGGAKFAFLKPKAWNGKLVVGCRFFMPQFVWDMFPNDPKNGMLSGYYGFGVGLCSQGYAFAYSTYGEAGFPVQKGIIRTHQLTEWVVDNFDISDEIYLFGYSMGYLCVLLAEKYPNLYDGVLDVAGTKDLKTRYNDWIGEPDPYGILPAIEAECGGTPEEKPKAYEKRSPVNNAGIEVKVISLYGELDANVGTVQDELFVDALEDAGSLDYYKGYIYPGYEHGTFMQNPLVIQLHFMDLVNWVENDIEPPADPYPIPPP
jgi:hypothetical protein